MLSNLAPTSTAACPVPAREVGVRCAHCGLGVPRGLVEDGAAEQFCCGACRVLREIATGRRGGLAEPSDGFEAFDDPAFASVYVDDAGGGLARIDLALGGLDCGPCVWQLERLPELIAGVAESRLELRRSVLRVTFDAARVKLSVIAAALAGLGYEPKPAKGRDHEAARRSDDRRQLVRLGVAGALAGNIMIFAFALYGGALGGIEPEFETFFRWVSAVLGTISLAWPGRVFFRSAIGSLRAGGLNLDVPICVALAAGGVMGALNTALGRGEIYFDSLSMLVFLLLAGRYVQHRQQRWAGDAVELLFSLMPSGARLVGADGSVREVPSRSLRVGDMVEVRPGESVPADGVVEDGASRVDQSLLTGEPMPASVRRGDSVFAGTVNVSSPVRVRVERTGEETRAGRLMALVEGAAGRKPEIVRFTDRVAVWFTVVVTLVAAATFAAWMFIEPGRAVDQAASLLIVTCPCALGLAVPLTMAVTIGRGAARGVLIKGGDVLERLATPGLMLIDKTGTLTAGRLSVVAWRGPEWAADAAAAVEAASTHPVAVAIRGFTAGDRAEATDIVETPGGGVRGMVGARRVIVGSLAFVRAQAVDVPAHRLADHDEMAARGLSPVVVAADEHAVAVGGVGDAARPEARATLDALRAQGWRVRILSGDHAAVVRGVGATLGLPGPDCEGGATPEDKLVRVREAVAGGERVVMIGDGVNDAAALAAATVGIAVHGGAEASLAAADVYLGRPGVAPVLELLEAARGAMRAVRVQLAASLAYNVAAGVLAVGGLINPMIAAVMMPLSSLTMLALAWRVKAFRGGAS